MTKLHELYVQRWAQDVLALSASADQYDATSVGDGSLELHDDLNGLKYVVEIRVFEVSE